MAKIDPTLSNVLARQLLLQALGLAKKMVPPLTDMLSEMALSKVGDVFKTSDDCPSQLRMLQLIELRNNLLHERTEWMNTTEVINYENELFRICSDYRINQDLYLSGLTIGNQSCPLCRKEIGRAHV